MEATTCIYMYIYIHFWLEYKCPKKIFTLKHTYIHTYMYIHNNTIDRLPTISFMEAFTKEFGSRSVTKAATIKYPYSAISTDS